MGIFTEFRDGLLTGYESIVGSVPVEYGSLLNVFIFAILISIYSIFTWKFYRHISKKDLLSLNLSQYNRSSHPVLKKFIAIIFYLIEYIVVLPFLIFFWFAILAFIIIVLSEDQTAAQILIISAAMVASIRILSYYEEDLSKDLAKMFPFTVLAIFALNPNFFSVARVLDRIAEIPSSFRNILFFLLFMVFVEIILRIVYLVVSFFGGFSHKEQPQEQTTQQQTQGQV